MPGQSKAEPYISIADMQCRWYTLGNNERLCWHALPIQPHPFPLRFVEREQRESREQMKMQVITTVQEMVDERSKYANSQRVGFVATMGYLHEGHLSLVRQGRKENEILMVSTFVNPAQFGPQEDLASYPRDLSGDLQMLEALDVDIVFTPTPEEIYPPGFVTYVEPTGPLATEAEGATRPGHFRGVATVVLKLFQIMQPHQAYFGQKDAQQVAVISRMVTDLNLPVKLRILSTIREADGLAMSSRNAYLDAEERAAAIVLYRALQAGCMAFEAQPEEGPSAVVKAMTDTVLAEPRAQLDYAQIRDPHSFISSLEELRAPALLLIAAKVGQARLIDNFLLQADGSWDTGIHVAEH
jgi:pantoate--beta-alanine ligase